jgi:hypothetical protein
MHNRAISINIQDENLFETIRPEMIKALPSTNPSTAQSIYKAHDKSVLERATVGMLEAPPIVLTSFARTQ